MHVLVQPTVAYLSNATNKTLINTYSVCKTRAHACTHTHRLQRISAGRRRNCSACIDSVHAIMQTCTVCMHCLQPHQTLMECKCVNWWPANLSMYMPLQLKAQHAHADKLERMVKYVQSICNMSTSDRVESAGKQVKRKTWRRKLLDKELAAARNCVQRSKNKSSSMEKYVWGPMLHKEF